MLKHINCSTIERANNALYYLSINHSIDRKFKLIEKAIQIFLLKQHLKEKNRVQAIKKKRSKKNTIL